MQVEIKIDGSYSEPKVIILTAAVTEDVNMLLLCCVQLCRRLDVLIE